MKIALALIYGGKVLQVKRKGSEYISNIYAVKNHYICSTWNIGLYPTPPYVTPTYPSCLSRGSNTGNGSARKFFQEIFSFLKPRVVVFCFLGPRVVSPPFKDQGRLQLMFRRCGSDSNFFSKSSVLPLRAQLPLGS